MTSKVTTRFAGDAFLDIFKEGVAAGLNKSIVYLQKEMKANMGTGSADTKGEVIAVQIRGRRRNAEGKLRKIRTRKNIYRAAAPGEFPGVRSGGFRASIAHEKATPATLVAAAGTNKKVGRWLEYGTYGEYGQLMAPRPWAIRSLMLAQEQMVSLCNNTVAAYIKAKGSNLLKRRRNK